MTIQVKNTTINNLIHNFIIIKNNSIMTDINSYNKIIKILIKILTHPIKCLFYHNNINQNKNNNL